MKNTEFVVVGGGIAGLTAAYELHQAGHGVELLEAAPGVGGVIASRHVNGFELDLGPNSLVMTPAMASRVGALGLQPLDAAAVAKNRYLVKDRVLHALSPHPLKLLKSSYLSGGAKWRIFTEQFRKRGNPTGESVGAFFTRRFGREVSQALADPVFSGIYAGDIDQLSLELVLPVVARWERDYGSVMKGLMKEKEVMKGGRRIVSFAGGLQSLTDALAASLTGHLHTNARVDGVDRVDGKYVVRYPGGEIAADKLVWTAPPGMLVPGGLSYSSVRTVHVTVPADALDLPEGFGFLVPDREGLSLMGCIFNSAIFPSKAPSGAALLTLMLGGAHHAAELRQDPDALQAKALEELKQILNVKGEARVLHAHTWTDAIPQKNIGYTRLMEDWKAYEQARPGFRFAGNAISGVSVGDSMEYAAKVVHSMI